MMNGRGLCPICGKLIGLRGGEVTTDGRLIGSCGDAFTKAQWVAPDDGKDYATEAEDEAQSGVIIPTQPAVLVEWTEHPKLRDLLYWVSCEFSHSEQRSFADNTEGINLKDLKYSMKHWAEAGIDRYEQLIKKIAELPDIEEEEIEL